MSSQAQIPSLDKEEFPLASRMLSGLAGGLALFASVLLVFSVGINLAYAGQAFPGVSMAGMDLSGMNAAQIEGQLAQMAGFEDEGQIELNFRERVWRFRPEELGYQFDVEGSVAAAMAVGREGPIWTRIGEQFQSLRGGFALEPRTAIDGQQMHKQLQGIASEINQEAIEAELRIEGLTVSGEDGQIGLEVNSEESALLLSALLLKRESASLPLSVVEDVPRILEVSEQVAIANDILSAELEIVPGGDYADNPEGWVFAPEELAAMLSVERVESEEGAFYQIGVNSQELGAMLAAWAPLVYEEAQNPRFIFNDDTRLLEVVQGEVIGRTLEIDASIEHINAEIAKGSHRIELQYDYANPDIRESVTGEELGITELVNAETTFFYGSSAERIQNIQTAAARFHGLLVPPGATFSMVENIGDISLETGFAEALIIFGDRTIKGVGGGVCQVSTTLFRNVFFAGFPVVERSPHAYRVYYYELNAAGGINPLAVGLDATVYSPIVDFKFVNDSEHWLLMETYVDASGRSLTWKFYSTADGRVVDWHNSGATQVVEAPEPIYEENEEFEQGEVEQVDWAADGAVVTVTRTVMRDGEELFADVFKTKYSPWAAVYQYGPGTPGYPPDDEKKPVE